MDDNIRVQLLLEGVVFEPIPDYGDLMTLNQFIVNYECGGFIDYDGFGNYATAAECTFLEVHPSDVRKNKIDKRFTHVVWYNK